MNEVVRAYGYYGSPIRHHLVIEPLFPIALISPAEEVLFQCQIDEKIGSPAHVSTRQVHFLHGFMNQYSVNCNEQGYQ